MMYFNNSRTWQGEHILGQALGGPDIFPNLIPICIDCNSKMGKDCRTTFDYMAKIGKITLDEAMKRERIHRKMCKRFDPVCEQQQKNGRRCINLKGGKDECFCWKHIKEQLEPMDCTD